MAKINHNKRSYKYEQKRALPNRYEYKIKRKFVNIHLAAAKETIAVLFNPVATTLTYERQSLLANFTPTKLLKKRK